MIRYRGGGKWEVAEWKNLHFRPPVLKDSIIGGGRVSDLILLRYAGVMETTYAGYLLIRKTDPNNYHICGRACKEHPVVPSQIEWMEVPE